MNGRAYDYNTGRFLSLDPSFIQSPANSQSINPYSYIMNNPLSGVDPTGYTAKPMNDGGDVPNNNDGTNPVVDISDKEFLSAEIYADGTVIVNTTDGSYQVVSETVVKSGGVSQPKTTKVPASASTVGKPEKTGAHGNSAKKSPAHADSGDGDFITKAVGEGSAFLALNDKGFDAVMEEREKRKDTIDGIKGDILDSDDIPSDFKESIRTTVFKYQDSAELDDNLANGREFGLTDQENQTALISSLHWDNNWKLNRRELVDTVIH